MWIGVGVKAETCKLKLKRVTQRERFFQEVGRCTGAEWNGLECWRPEIKQLESPGGGTEQPAMMGKQVAQGLLGFLGQIGYFSLYSKSGKYFILSEILWGGYYYQPHFLLEEMEVQSD